MKKCVIIFSQPFFKRWKGSDPVVAVLQGCYTFPLFKQVNEIAGTFKAKADRNIVDRKTGHAEKFFGRVNAQFILILTGRFADIVLKLLLQVKFIHE